MSRLKVLVTAATSSLGRGLCHDLYDDVGRVEHVFAVAKGEELPYYFREFHRDRFTYWGADLLKERHLKGLFLAERFREHQIDQVVHCGFLRSIKEGRRHPSDAVEGTRRFLRYCLDAGIAHFVYVSGCLVYRLRPWTSSSIDESAELDYDPDADPWSKARVDTDAICRTQMDQDGIRITVLRPGPIMGRNQTSHLGDLLGSYVVTTLAGYDPVIRPTHSSDLRRAINRVLDQRPVGVFNVAGPDIAPLSEFCRLNHRPSVSLPGPLLKSFNRLQRMLRLSTVDLSTLPRWLMYPCVLDTTRIERTIGFRGMHHIKFGD